MDSGSDNASLDPSSSSGYYQSPVSPVFPAPITNEDHATDDNVHITNVRKVPALKKSPITYGTNRLHYQGYSYALNKAGKSRDTYRCAHKKRYKCNGTLTCNKDREEVRECMSHSHPRVHKTDLSSKIKALKMQALRSLDPPSSIVNISTGFMHTCGTTGYAKRIITKIILP